MAKYFNFNRVAFSVEPTSSYGRYKVTAQYGGRMVTAYTTDAEAYDYCDDDEPNGLSRRAARLRMMAARRHFLWCIRGAYEKD